MKVATGEKTLLTEGDKARWDMAQYSPDGRSLYGLSNRGGNSRAEPCRLGYSVRFLHTRPARGGGPEEGDPVWSVGPGEEDE